MMHIQDFDWDRDDSYIASLERAQVRDARSGPCEDSVEMTAPFLGMMPEESNHEGGTPPNFSPDEVRAAAYDRIKRIDAQIEETLRVGFTPAGRIRTVFAEKNAEGFTTRRMVPMQRRGY